jgi:uncharacterized protein YecT (DUF1311 family)
MQKSSLFLFLLATSATGPVFAECEGPPDIVGACDELDAANSKLNAAYRKLLDDLDNAPPEMKEHHKSAKSSVIIAQRAWLKFRDSDCQAVYDIADGTSKTPLSISCEAEHDLLRAKQLEDMANGL